MYSFVKTSASFTFSDLFFVIKCVFFFADKSPPRRTGRCIVAMGTRTLNRNVAGRFGWPANQVRLAPETAAAPQKSPKLRLVYFSESKKTSLASATENNRLPIPFMI